MPDHEPICILDTNSYIESVSRLVLLSLMVQAVLVLVLLVPVFPIVILCLSSQSKMYRVFLIVQLSIRPILA